MEQQGKCADDATHEQQRVFRVQDAYPYAQVSRQIAAVEQQCFEFNVQQLCFGDYQAQQLQGQLDPQYVFELQST